jgi:hypothetical protein
MQVFKMRLLAAVGIFLIVATCSSTVYSKFLFNHYDKMYNKLIYERTIYKKLNVSELCIILNCKGIYQNNKYYEFDKNTKKINSHQNSNHHFLNSVYSNSILTMRDDFSFDVVVSMENYDEPVYFVLDSQDFIVVFMIFFIVVTIFVIYVDFIMYKIPYYMDTIKNLKENNNKLTIGNDNLIFYINHLQHTISSPLFNLSREIKELKNAIKDKTFDENFKILINYVNKITLQIHHIKEVKKQHNLIKGNNRGVNNDNNTTI